MLIIKKLNEDVEVFVEKLKTLMVLNNTWEIKLMNLLNNIFYIVYIQIRKKR
jgi:hypothetical protein